MWRVLARRPVLVSVVGAGTAVATYKYVESQRPLEAHGDALEPLVRASRVYAESARDAILAGAGKTAASSQLQASPTSALLPSRTEMLNMLKGKTRDGKTVLPADDTVYDLVIVGGGATGVGCALDAQTRGLKTALVERDDFASGTSSRSTKLVHGGVRYLEKAFMELDYEQYKLVREALHERGVFLKIAPYLSYQLPIMLPVTQWWKIPYYWAGAKAYDVFAGSEGLSHSYFLTKSRALEAFPMLQKDKVKGAIIYYDGAHNDSRMNVAIALTAAAHGAAIANHVEVVGLLKRARLINKDRFDLGDEELYGVVVRDTLTGDTWNIRAKGVINATGPFTDGIRKLDGGAQAQEIVAPSAGVHIILPNYFSPRNMGLLDPNTSDGRVIFFLPWQGSVIVGTTDTPTQVTHNPIPNDDDINWLLKEVSNYLAPEIKVRRGDVLAAWSGIRPLVRDPAAKNTAALVRNHMINVSPSGLLTIAGGKWTTFRSMAQETIDKAIEVFDLKPTGPCITEHLPLIGSAGWSKTMFIKLIQHFGLETEVAQHLSDSYGDRAWAVAALAAQTGTRWPIFGVRVAPGYPYIEAEVRYACQREYACTAVDVVARRLRLSFLNAQATLAALPRIVEIMAQELGWDRKRKQKEIEETTQFLMSMGLTIKDKTMFPANGAKPVIATLSQDQARFFARTHFLPTELAFYREVFNKLDYDRDGTISKKDFGLALDKIGHSISPEDLASVMDEVDLNHSGSIEYEEFLEVLAAVKDIRSRSKFARIVAKYEERQQFPTDRSGGGV
ncbi:FAD dependent oxidoreductase-domain-containing protein [Entophlyctis helioformis]|nr:FAD dependent oxidoreductase-domain-containing protein [Entophlyctis helioformis]